MRFLWRWLKRLVLLLAVLLAALLTPVGYVELACQGETAVTDYAALLPPEHRRLESRTLMTLSLIHI